MRTSRVLFASLILASAIFVSSRAQADPAFNSGYRTKFPPALALSCTNHIKDGELCWDVDDDLLYSGDGSTAVLIGPGSAGAPVDATYITQTSNGTLTGEQALSLLGTGLVKNTTGTGVLSIAVAGTDYQAAGNYITDLTGEVTATGPGSVAATITAQNSAFWAGKVTDETGTGLWVFNAAPAISDADLSGVTDIQESWLLSGDISPAQITAQADDYNPTGLSTASVLRLDTDASRDITGLAGGANGRPVLIMNVGANDIVLKDESASSTAANRFALNADITIAPDQTVGLWYDGTSSRWRISEFAAQGGGVGALTLEEADSTVDAATANLDFGAGFDLTSSPAGEVNVLLDYSEDPVDLATGDVTGVLPAANGGSIWTDAGTYAHLTTTGDEVVIGSSTDLGGLLNVDGHADVEQVVIQAHSTQTSPLITGENSSATDLWQLTPTQFLAPDGAVGTPSYSFLNMSDAGIYAIPGSNDSLSFATMGIRRFELTNSGGTTAVRYWGGSDVKFSHNGSVVSRITSGLDHEINSDKNPGVDFTIFGDVETLFFSDSSEEAIVFGSSTVPANSFVTIDNHTATDTALILQGAAAQSAPMLTVEDSAGTDAHQITLTQILAADGTEALPSHSFLSNPDTGMYTDGTNLIFSHGGNDFLLLWDGGGPQAQFQFETSGVKFRTSNAQTSLYFDSSLFEFNPDRLDKNFTVNGDTINDLFFVDAGEDALVLGSTTVPANSFVTIDGHTATDVQFIVEGATSQSANLQEWRDSASTQLGRFEIDGDMQIDGDMTISGDDLFMGTNTDAFILVADGTNFNPVAMSGDVTVDNTGATTVGDDSHSHTTTTLSSIDISADTNLAVTAPIVLTDDTLSCATATTTTQGCAEAAIASEVTTGTDTARIVTPDALAGSDYGKRVVSLLVFDDSEDNATGDGAGSIFWRVPAVLNGYNLVAVAAQVQTAGTTGTVDIQVHNVTDTADMLSTVITIDSAEVDSSTAATPAVINGATDDVATADSIRVDVDAVHTTPAKGLLVELTFQLP